MKILILGISKKRMTGLESWSNILKNYYIKQNCEITEIYTKSLFSILFNFSKIINYDISHSYTQQPGALLIILIRKLIGKKHIHTVHGDFFEENKSKSFLKKLLWIPLNKACINISDKLTFPSNFIYSKILLKLPKIRQKSLVISNPIDQELLNSIKGFNKESLGFKRSDFIIMEITRFHLEEKARGIDTLVEEFKIFNKKMPNSYLVIIGGGKLLDKYKKKYSCKKIIFLGLVSDAFRYLNACDLFVHYSYLDSFGYVLLEALSLNKPVIAKGSPAFNEIISTKYELKNIDKKEINLIHEKQKNLVKKFNINKIGKEFLELYNKALYSEK